MSINGKQSVELKNYFKQIPVPFKTYPDSECDLRGAESYESSCTKNYQDHISCSFASKVVCIDDRFTKPIVVFIGENAAHEIIKAILQEYKYCKKIMNKHLNKNLIKKTNIYFNKVTVFGFVNEEDEEKIRDHFHVTGKFRGAAHLQLT